MKRNNKLMRASGILLVLTLITSCFVGGTFAKYVSEGEASDTARVAKWGVEVEVTGEAFKQTYSNDDTGAGVGIVVQSDDKVVAPGTYGTFGGIKITGTPEVAVKVNTEADFELGDNWKDENGDYYCPIVIDINGVQYCGLDDDYPNADSFENAVETAINNYISDTYPAGTELDGQAKLNSEIKWRWAFDNRSLNDLTGTFAFNDDIKNTLGSKQTDEKDTALGDKVADGQELKITLGFKTTVTQID